MRIARKQTVRGAAALVIIAGTTLPGCSSALGCGIGGAIGAVTAFIVAKSAGANDTQAGLWAAGVGAVACGVTYVVMEHQKRKADEEEKRIAVNAGQDRVETLTVAEKSIVDKQEHYLAVQVGETETTTLVMLVEPETGYPISDEVYEVPKSELDNLETLADVKRQEGETDNPALSTREYKRVQQESNDRADVVGNTQPTTPPADSGATPPSDDVAIEGGAPAGTTVATTPAPGEAVVSEDNIRFGKLGSKRVIFRVDS